MKPWQNKSGCNDPTAYRAIKNADEDARKAADFIRCIVTLARLCGFELVDRLKVREKKSGRVY